MEGREGTIASQAPFYPTILNCAAADRVRLNLHALCRNCHPMDLNQLKLQCPKQRRINILQLLRGCIYHRQQKTQDDGSLQREHQG